jgi:hypothetical protein
MAVWINSFALEADIARFMPLVSIVASMIPGAVGNSILSFLRAVTAPDVLETVVSLINTLTGAQPPVTPTLASNLIEKPPIA